MKACAHKCYHAKSNYADICLEIELMVEMTKTEIQVKTCQAQLATDGIWNNWIMRTAVTPPIILYYYNCPKITKLLCQMYSYPVSSLIHCLATFNKIDQYA